MSWPITPAGVVSVVTNPILTGSATAADVASRRLENKPNERRKRLGRPVFRSACLHRWMNRVKVEENVKVMVFSKSFTL